MSAKLEALLESGGDGDDWQVYGDWLIEQGDPRGELVALSIAHDASGNSAKKKTLAAKAKQLLAKLEAPLLARATRNPVVKLDWRYGFVERARFVEPWQPCEPTARDQLVSVLAEPALRFVRELEIDREDRSDVSLGDLGRRGIYEWAAPVLDKLDLPQLRRLRIGSEPDDDMHLSETSNSMMTSDAPGTPGAKIFRPDRYVGAVALGRMPKLRELHVTGEGIRIDKLPRTLRKLVIETRFLRQSTLKAIASAKLPKLEELVLWLGNWPDSVTELKGPEGKEYYGGPTSIDDLAPLLDGAGFPNLTHLSLVNCAWMADVIAAIPKSKVLATVNYLDLSWGFTTSKQAQPLLAHADHLHGLQRIDVSHNQIVDPAIQRRLRKTFGKKLVLDHQAALEGNAAIRMLSF